MIVVIPTIWESPYLPSLLDVLEQDNNVFKVVLVDNSTETSLLGGTPVWAPIGTPVWAPISRLKENGRVLLLNTNGLSIYAAWNIGIQMGDAEDEYVACLNDDLVLPAGSLAAAEAAFDSPCPQNAEWGLIGLNYFEPNGPVDATAPVKEVVGTYRTTGFGGFAFVLPPDSPFADEKYNWWYGDDDLGERIKATGRKLGLATGAPVDHPAPGTSSRKHPRPPEHYEQDLARFRRIWPDAP